MKKYSFARSGTTRALLFAILLFTFSACDSGGGGDSGTNPDPGPNPTPVKEVAAIILSGDMPNEIGETEEITATVLDQDNNAWTEQELTDSSITVNIVASSNAVTITKKSVTKVDITAVTNCVSCVVSANAGSVQSQNTVSGEIYPDITKLTTAKVTYGSRVDLYAIGFIPINGQDNKYDLQGLESEGAFGTYYIEGNTVKTDEQYAYITFTISSIENGIIKKLSAQFGSEQVGFQYYEIY